MSNLIGPKVMLYGFSCNIFCEAFLCKIFEIHIFHLHIFTWVCSFKIYDGQQFFGRKTNNLLNRFFSKEPGKKKLPNFGRLFQRFSRSSRGYDFLPGAPPPLTSMGFCTRHLRTQRASWRDLSASSNRRLFEPLRIMEAVLALALVTPVTLVTFFSPMATRSTHLAAPRTSG